MTDTGHPPADYPSAAAERMAAQGALYATALTAADGSPTDVARELTLAGVPSGLADTADVTVTVGSRAARDPHEAFRPVDAPHRTVRGSSLLLPTRPTQAEINAAPDLALAIRDLDSRRARSKQRMIGASELGECRRRAAYRISKAKPTNHSTGLQAFLGTEIHKGVLRALRRLYGGYTEVKVHGDQVKGSVDWYIPPVVEDLKTTSKGGYEKVQVRGAYVKHWFQVVTYAWLLRTGQIRDRRLHPGDEHPVEVMRIRYLSRDSGEDLPFERPYDPLLAIEAILWLTDVYTVLEENDNDPEAVDRDGYGPGIDTMCDWCPFLDLCWGPPIEPEREAEESRQSRLTVTDEDFAAALRDYDESRTAEAEAKRRKEFARERLRGRTGSAGDLHCAWSGGNERYAVDKDAALEELIALGRELPTKKVTSPRAIRVARNVKG